MKPFTLKQSEKAFDLLKLCVLEFGKANEIIMSFGHHGFVLTPNDINDFITEIKNENLDNL